MKRLPAVLVAAALLAAAVLVGSIAGAGHPHNLDAGHGPVPAAAPASQPSWWICGAPTGTRLPC